MNISLQKKDGFTVAGLKKMEICNTFCHEVWDELFKKHSMEMLESLGHGKSYGVCFDITSPDYLNYMAGYEVTDLEIADRLNLDVMDIPANEYAVVQLKGSVPKCILDGWQFVLNEYFPEHGLKHSGDPDLEVYFDGELHSPDYEMELWVPIARV